MTLEEEIEARRAMAEALAPYREQIVSETIDGIVYTSSKFPTLRGFGILGRLAVALGEQGLRMVATNVASLRKTFGVSVASKPQLFGAIVVIMQGMNEDPKLIPDLLSQTKCNAIRPGGRGGELTESAINTHFCGELPHLLDVLQFVIKHNLAGFTLGSLSTSGSHTNPETSSEP